MTRIRITPTVERTGPTDLWHLAEGPELPGRVWFRLSASEAGAWICTEVLVESAGKPLTTSVLRSIPISRIVDQLSTQPWTEDDRGGGLDLETGVREHYGDAGESDAAARARYMGNVKRPPKLRPKPRVGGSGPTDAELAKLAETYAWALRKHRASPIKAVAENMSISRATAHRWLKLLEERNANG